MSINRRGVPDPTTTVKGKVESNDSMLSNAKTPLSHTHVKEYTTNIYEDMVKMINNRTMVTVLW